MDVVSRAAGVRTPVASLFLSQWDALASSVSDPNFELDVEAFAAIASAYARLKRAGQTFDPMLSALIACLSRQAYLSEEAIEEGDLTGDLDSHVSPTWSAATRARDSFRAAKGGRHA